MFLMAATLSLKDSSHAYSFNTWQQQYNGLHLWGGCQDCESDFYRGNLKFHCTAISMSDRELSHTNATRALPWFRSALHSSVWSLHPCSASVESEASSVWWPALHWQVSAGSSPQRQLERRVPCCSITATQLLQSAVVRTTPSTGSPSRPAGVGHQPTSGWLSLRRWRSCGLHCSSLVPEKTAVLSIPGNAS